MSSLNYRTGEQRWKKISFQDKQELPYFSNPFNNISNYIKNISEENTVISRENPDSFSQYKDLPFSMIELGGGSAQLVFPEKKILKIKSYKLNDFDFRTFDSKNKIETENKIEKEKENKTVAPYNILNSYKKIKNLPSKIYLIGGFEDLISKKLGKKVVFWSDIEKRFANELKEIKDKFNNSKDTQNNINDSLNNKRIVNGDENRLKIALFLISSLVPENSNPTIIFLNNMKYKKDLIGVNWVLYKILEMYKMDLKLDE